MNSSALFFWFEVLRLPTAAPSLPTRRRRLASPAVRLPQRSLFCRSVGILCPRRNGQKSCASCAFDGRRLPHVMTRRKPVSFPETKWIPNLESHPVTFYPARENSMLRAGSQRTESTERTYARLGLDIKRQVPLTQQTPLMLFLFHIVVRGTSRASRDDSGDRPLSADSSVERSTAGSQFATSRERHAGWCSACAHKCIEAPFNGNQRKRHKHTMCVTAV